MYEELFHALHRDHEEVRATFRRSKDEDSASDRAKILYELETEILPHMLAEEQIVYPRLQAEEGDTRQDAFESIAEHHAVRLVLRDLTETPTNDETFPAKVRVLEDMVEHHCAGRGKGYLPGYPQAPAAGRSRRTAEEFHREQGEQPLPAGES